MTSSFFSVLPSSPVLKDDDVGPPDDYGTIHYRDSTSQQRARLVRDTAAFVYIVVAIAVPLIHRYDESMQTDR